MSLEPSVVVALHDVCPAFDVSPAWLQRLERSVAPARVIPIGSPARRNTRADEAQVIAHLPSAVAMLTWRFRSAWYAHAPRLQAIFTPAAGREWLAVPPTDAVQVHHGTFHGPMMAEHLLGMLLHFQVRVPQLLAQKEAALWERHALYRGRRLLRQQTVVILGYGQVGQSCARVLSAFGSHVIGVRRHPERSEEASIPVVGVEDLHSILGKADHIVSVLPGTPENDAFCDTGFFAACKAGAHFFNLGRGSTVDEDALLAALRSGRLAGAGLDVFAHEPLPAGSPLWQEPNVLMSPHAACCYDDYLELFWEHIQAPLRQLFSS